MTFKKKYKSVFSQVCTPKTIKMEDFLMKQSVKVKSRKVLAFVAVLCLLAALSVSALAMNLFGLRSMVLPNTRTESNVGPNGPDGNENTGNTESSEPVESVIPKEPQLISLQGYSDSKEYQAVAEWIAFLDNYDKDGELLAKVGNGPTGLDKKYSLYPVYTQEMADKLDEITSKYGLKLHSTIELDLTTDELYAKAGTGKFLGEENTSMGAYVYEDGTFHIDGEVTLDEDRKIMYQMMNCKKGSFTDVILNIGNLDEYDGWNYDTASGVTAGLYISSSKSLVVADFNDSFMTINVLAGSDSGMYGPITASDLEEFADTFDFSALN